MRGMSVCAEFLKIIFCDVSAVCLSLCTWVRACMRVWVFCSFVRSFSFIRSFICLFVELFVCLFACLVVCLVVSVFVWVVCILLPVHDLRARASLKLYARMSVYVLCRAFGCAVCIGFCVLLHQYRRPPPPTLFLLLSLVFSHGLRWFCHCCRARHLSGAKRRWVRFFFLRSPPPRTFFSQSVQSICLFFSSIYFTTLFDFSFVCFLIPFKDLKYFSV